MPFVQVQFRFGETVTVDQIAHELDLIAEEFDVAAVAVPGIEIQRSLSVAAGFEEGVHRRQIVADVLGMPLQRMHSDDSSIGSAMLAGVAVGAFADHRDAVRKCVRVTGVTEPDPEGAEFYGTRFPLYKQIQAALAPIYHRL